MYEGGVSGHENNGIDATVGIGGLGNIGVGESESMDNAFDGTDVVLDGFDEIVVLIDN